MIRLPWAVLAQANHRLVPVKSGSRVRLILSKDYRQAKDAAGLLATAQWKGDALSGPVMVEIAFYEPDKRVRDPSNLQKLIEDCLTGVCYADDSQIADLRWFRAGIDRANPRAEITVEELEA
jgi:Holliday junction resolvase RusA-like endonuclease